MMTALGRTVLAKAPFTCGTIVASKTRITNAKTFLVAEPVGHTSRDVIADRGAFEAIQIRKAHIAP